MVSKEYPRIGEKIYHAELPNGLHIYVDRRPEFQKSYAFFATNYGGMDMKFRLDGQWRDTPAGVAHFLEHKMFDTKEGNALQELAANGASPNAFTSNAITGYYFESTEKFEENLRILLSFVSIPYFTKESVDKEQGIIGQEIGMIEDDPDWVVFMDLMQALYEKHPVRVSVAGSAESISHITAETLYACHKAFYDPSNMVLCVAGDVDPEKICQAAREILPERPGAPVAPGGLRRPGARGGVPAHDPAGRWRSRSPCSSWDSRGRRPRRERGPCASSCWASWPVRHFWATPARCMPDSTGRGWSTGISPMGMRATPAALSCVPGGEQGPGGSAGGGGRRGGADRTGGDRPRAVGAAEKNPPTETGCGR